MNNVDLVYMVKLALLVAVIVVGVMQWLKNFLKTQKGKLLSIASVILVIIVAILNTSLVPQWVTVTVDVVLLSLAITQLAWDVLAKSVPSAVESLINKVVDVKSSSK
jgi:hypothetical protein